jgi:hypothetical protein
MLCLVLLGAARCGTVPQVSGIVAMTTIETVACQPRKKTLQIRNSNPTEPQRIQGVHFELGTNSKRFFKVEEVIANGRSKTAVENLVEEVMLPPGGHMDVVISYNPKVVTAEGEYHDTYLDVVLNGPRLGVMQIEIRGTAPTAMPGCSEDSGNARVFEVVKATTFIDDVDLADNPSVVELDLATQVQGDFKFIIDGDKVVLPFDGWPTVILVPPGQGDIPVTLSEDSPEGSFVDGQLTIEGITLLVTGVPLTDVTLTTGTASTEAADISTGTLSKTGVAFDEASGKMTLVLAMPLVHAAFESFPIFNGGFAAVIELKEKTQAP